MMGIPAGTGSQTGFSRWWTLATVVLAGTGVFYVGTGFVNLLGLFGTEGAGDLMKRWVEHAYFVRGMSPLDVYSGAQPTIPEVGSMHPGSYPPWSLLTGLALVPPIDRELVRWYFAALNLAAFALTLTGAYRLGRPHGVFAARLFAASTAAIFANAITLRHGQYGLLINALLSGMLLMLARSNSIWGGLLLGVSALKPQTSTLFALLWLRRRGILALATAAVWVGAAGLIATLWVGRSPLAFLSLAYRQAAAWDDGDNGLLGVALAWGLPRAPVSLGLAVVGSVGSAWLVHRYREHSLLTQAAIVCVLGRLWMYHRRYDDTMLVFLLLALALEAVKDPKLATIVPFSLVGLTLWLPLRESHHTPLVVLTKALVWIGGLVWLLLRKADSTAPTSDVLALGHPH